MDDLRLDFVWRKFLICFEDFLYISMLPHAVSGDTAMFIYSLGDKDPDLLIYSEEELNVLEKVMANE